MINRIDSSYQSLQGSQSAKTVQLGGKKTSSVFGQALAQELQAPQAQVHKRSPEAAQWEPQANPRSIDTRPQPEPQAAAQRPEVRRPVMSQQAHLDPMLKEVQDIAEASGFIGVSRQDILRAYNSGQSFLADYRV